ncbi:MAG: 4Fe-4S binding protein [Pseudoflavonifractor sp.]|nr:4Fe-4S binding protein [Pseudoflavonifractor sp.]
MTFQRLRMLVRFITCFLILLAVAVQRNGTVFGHDITAPQTASNRNAPITVSDGVTIINTTDIASDIKGYGGPIPLEITIKGDKIAAIETLKNAESEDFFNQVRDRLIPQWIGTPTSEVQSKSIDAISGATLSSRAVNATIKAGVAYSMSDKATQPVDPLTDADRPSFGLKSVAALIVVICAAIIPIFVRDRRYRYTQLLLNVIVLGFWSGTFLSYEVFVNYISNGANLWQSLVALLMLVVAFVYPYFGRKSHYCTWICPLGALQELAGRATRFKLKMSPRLVRGLTAFQEILWLALMFVMCAGIWFEWMNWELFTAFIFEQAAVGVLVAAVLFITLSVIVNRPYCRFVCPTGCLFQITQNPDK